MSQANGIDDLRAEELSFEEAFQQLEATVQRLEEGELTLDEAIALYEEGMRLAKHCGDSLDAAELRVRQVSLAAGQQQLGMFFEDGRD